MGRKLEYECDCKYCTAVKDRVRREERRKVFDDIEKVVGVATVRKLKQSAQYQKLKRLSTKK